MKRAAIFFLLLCIAFVIAGRKGRLLQTVPSGTHIIRNLTSITFVEPDGQVHFRSLPSNINTPKKRDSGWIASVWTFADYTYYTATWDVPSPPDSYNDQTVFFFNSLEGVNYNDILQPVLQFNDGGGNGWFIAAWYGLPNGDYVESTPVSVSQGDVLRGIIQLSDDGSTWTIAFHVNGAASTSLTVSASSVGTQGNAEFALEVYGITECNQYPQSGTLSVRSIELKVGGTVVSPSWSTSVNSNDCQAGASASGADATITWVPLIPE